VDAAEQGKLPAAQAFKLAERDKQMSEQKKAKSFMQELNLWIAAQVIHPLIYGDSPEDPDARSQAEVIDQVRQEIRKKVLESYHNGQAVGPRKAAGRRS
jgi:hypothetical protein